jgi:hypothetical protein
MSEPGDTLKSVQRQRRGGPDPVFTASFRFQEDPAILKRLEEHASDSGHSVAAEVRAAIRYWLSAWETEP